jgi:hypothetical protein
MLRRTKMGNRVRITIARSDARYRAGRRLVGALSKLVCDLLNQKSFRRRYVRRQVSKHILGNMHERKFKIERKGVGRGVSRQSQ